MTENQNQVLYVGGDEYNGGLREILEIHLKSKGYTPTRVTSVGDLSDKLSTGSYKAVIIDPRTGLSNADFEQVFRGRNENVVYLSSDSTEDYITIGCIGTCKVMNFPIKPQTLVEKIESPVEVYATQHLLKERLSESVNHLKSQLHDYLAEVLIPVKYDLHDPIHRAR